MFGSSKKTTQPSVCDRFHGYEGYAVTLEQINPYKTGYIRFNGVQWRGRSQVDIVIPANSDVRACGRGRGLEILVTLL